MQISIKKSARKDLLKLPNLILLKTFKAILDLIDNPFPRGHDKVESKINRYRVWIDRKYRLLYEIDKKTNKIVIVAVKPKDEHTYK